MKPLKMLLVIQSAKHKLKKLKQRENPEDKHVKHNKDIQWDKKLLWNSTKGNQFFMQINYDKILNKHERQFRWIWHFQDNTDFHRTQFITSNGHKLQLGNRLSFKERTREISLCWTFYKHHNSAMRQQHRVLHKLKNVYIVIYVCVYIYIYICITRD